LNEPDIASYGCRASLEADAPGDEGAVGTPSFKFRLERVRSLRERAEEAATSRVDLAVAIGRTTTTIAETPALGPARSSRSTGSRASASTSWSPASRSRAARWS
jgi:hypothetical protein